VCGLGSGDRSSSVDVSHTSSARFVSTRAWIVRRALERRRLGLQCNSVRRPSGHKYEPQTLILLQSPCATFEANFIYLLIGSGKGLLIDTGAAAYHESALRIVDFMKTRPLTHILGGYIELNAAGHAYRFGSHYHPNEHRLELARADLTALPAAFERFKGFYARYPNYILTNPIHNLLALAFLAVGIDFHRVGSAPLATQPAARSSVGTVETAVSAAVMIRMGGACAAI
jgi:hypothetical protein